MTLAKKRYKMKMQLNEQEVDDRWQVRPISQQDGSLLATLLLESYRGTIDDEGYTPETALTEMTGTLGGKYGPLIKGGSLLIGERGQGLCAAIVTHWEGVQQPLLVFLMTHPTAKNQGMGTFLLKKSINGLLAQDESELYLFVTQGNLPAQHLYSRLGFRTVERYRSSTEK